MKHNQHKKRSIRFKLNQELARGFKAGAAELDLDQKLLAEILVAHSVFHCGVWDAFAETAKYPTTETQYNFLYKTLDEKGIAAFAKRSWDTELTSLHKGGTYGSPQLEVVFGKLFTRGVLFAVKELRRCKTHPERVKLTAEVFTEIAKICFESEARLNKDMPLDKDFHIRMHYDGKDKNGSPKVVRVRGNFSPSDKGDVSHDHG